MIKEGSMSDDFFQEGKGLRQKPEGNVNSRESDRGQRDGKCVPGGGNSKARQ